MHRHAARRILTSIGPHILARAVLAELCRRHVACVRRGRNGAGWRRWRRRRGRRGRRANERTERQRRLPLRIDAPAPIVRAALVEGRLRNQSRRAPALRSSAAHHRKARLRGRRRAGRTNLKDRVPRESRDANAVPREGNIHGHRPAWPAGPPGRRLDDPQSERAVA